MVRIERVGCELKSAAGRYEQACCAALSWSEFTVRKGNERILDCKHSHYRWAVIEEGDSIR